MKKIFFLLVLNSAFVWCKDPSGMQYSAEYDKIRQELAIAPGADNNKPHKNSSITNRVKKECAAIARDLTAGNPPANPGSAILEMRAHPVCRQAKYILLAMLASTFISRDSGLNAGYDTELVQKVIAMPMAETCVAIPILEEALFTYLPQAVKRIVEGIARRHTQGNVKNALLELTSYLPILSAVSFGWGHKYQGIGAVAITAAFNYSHQAYLEEHTLFDYAPIYDHMLQNTGAVTAHRIWYGLKAALSK